MNEHSLRDFLTYIEEYKRNPRGTSLGKPRRIPLTFFIKNENTGELKKVQSELISNSTNSSAAKRRLMNLFAACGLESDFTFEKDVWIPSDTASLQEFLSSSLFHAREYQQKVYLLSYFYLRFLFYFYLFYKYIYKCSSPNYILCKININKYLNRQQPTIHMSTLSSVTSSESTVSESGCRSEPIRTTHHPKTVTSSTDSSQS